MPAAADLHDDLAGSGLGIGYLPELRFSTELHHLQGARTPAMLSHVWELSRVIGREVRPISDRWAGSPI